MSPTLFSPSGSPLSSPLSPMTRQPSQASLFIFCRYTKAGDDVKKCRLLGFCATETNNWPNALKLSFSGKKMVDAPEPDTHNSARTVTR